ncbi:hypothetical protein J6590_024128 [Homalodisca vitripennis]|nr:hypothetical protein J6590_024128 [Homalodisca vitripennis]
MVRNLTTRPRNYYWRDTSDSCYWSWLETSIRRLGLDCLAASSYSSGERVAGGRVGPTPHPSDWTLSVADPNLNPAFNALFTADIKTRMEIISLTGASPET